MDIENYGKPVPFTRDMAVEETNVNAEIHDQLVQQMREVAVIPCIRCHRNLIECQCTDTQLNEYLDAHPATITYKKGAL